MLAGLHHREAAKAARRAFEELGVERVCCRRMFLGHVDLLEDLVQYPNVDTPIDDNGTVLKREARAVRVVSCDRRRALAATPSRPLHPFHPHALRGRSRRRFIRWRSSASQGVSARASLRQPQLVAQAVQLEM